jgi:hypothetical protein
MTKSNVNPDHYKTAGRERQGDDTLPEFHKQKLTQADAARAGHLGEANFILGAPPVGERPSDTNAEATSAGSETVGQVNEAANSSSGA